MGVREEGERGGETKHRSSEAKENRSSDESKFNSHNVGIIGAFIGSPRKNTLAWTHTYAPPNSILLLANHNTLLVFCFSFSRRNNQWMLFCPHFRVCPFKTNLVLNKTVSDVNRIIFKTHMH